MKLHAIQTGSVRIKTAQVDTDQGSFEVNSDKWLDGPGARAPS
jgi:hypothetical protein